MYFDFKAVFKLRVNQVLR